MSTRKNRRLKTNGEPMPLATIFLEVHSLTKYRIQFLAKANNVTMSSLIEDTLCKALNLDDVPLTEVQAARILGAHRETIRKARRTKAPAIPA